MNVKQLISFREVMITGSVSKAAENLFRTQPAVSAQINSLEKEIGIKLFERREGRLHPVPEAEYLLSQANEIIEKLEDIQENIEKVKNLETGRINIVAMLGPSLFFLPRVISEFVEDKDDVDVSLFSHNSFQAQQLVSSQCYDIGVVDFMNDCGASSALLHQERIDYECVCAIPSDDPLADKTSISASDLDGKPLALLAESHDISEKLRVAFDERGLKLNRRFETKFFIPQLLFVENSLAYAIVDPITVESYKNHFKSSEKIVFLPFEPVVTFSISIITPAHRPLSTLANAFRDYLRKELVNFN